MNLKLRFAILIFVTGIAILVAGFQIPLTSTSANSISGLSASSASQTYFFQPVNIAISISQLQGSAILLVQPVSYDASFGVPIVNVSVVSLDIVTFSISQRGYYALTFLYSNGTSAAASYVINESGVPQDMVNFGVILTGMGGILSLVILLSSKKIIRFSSKRYISR
jgi:hypothetical protein